MDAGPPIEKACPSKMKGRDHVKGLRVVLGTVATASLVLGAMGVAFAQSTTTYETRADFIYQLDTQLGIKPVYPPTPNFSDVPTTSTYYGYIEAAYQAGITNGFSNGTFGPNLPLTRAEAAKYEVVAYGDGSAAQSITTTSFTDNATIPTALVGYVAEANKLGLLKGFPNGTFQPDASLTTAQERDLLKQLATAMATSGTGSTAGYTVKVTATPSDVSPGQFVTLTALVQNSSGAAVDTPVTYTVTGANSSNVLLSGSSFVASQPGTYTVQATAGTATGTTTINVYGAATGIKISAPTTIVANGNASSKVTVSFVDASGNVVANDTSSVTLTTNNSFAVGVMNGTVSSGAASADAVNGVATFEVEGGSVPGSSATLTATSGSFSATATVTTATQTASSISVTPASPYLAANAPGATQTVTVTVDDQSGQPMLYGTYAFTVSLSGPATFSGGSTTPQSFVYAGTGPNSTGTPVTIEDVQGSTGQITITASATGLTSGTGTVTAVIAGSPTAIQITPPATSSFSADNAGVGLKFGIAIVDSHGYPVSNGQSVMITVKNSSGQIAQNIKVDGLSQTSTSGVVDSSAVTLGHFTLSDAGTGPDAGTYTVQATDPSGVLSPSGVVTFTETPGAAKAIQLTAPQYISAADPTATYTAQIVDAFGNPVPMSGVPVTFSSTASNITPPTQTVDTNASGQAQANFTVPGYVGSAFPVSATATLNGQTYTTNPASFTVESTTAQAISITASDNTSSSTYYTYPGMAQSGDQVRITIKATDQYGNLVPTADKVLITPSGAGTLTNVSTAVLGGGGLGNVTVNSNGTWTVTLFAGQAVIAANAGVAGEVSLQATDQSVTPNAVGNTALSVVAGQVSGFALYDSAGNLASGESIAANSPAQLTLRAVDSADNAAIPTENFLVVPMSSQGGQFRVGSPSGADLGPTQGVLLSTGSGGSSLYYVTGSAQTGVNFTAPYWVGYPSGVAQSNGILLTQNNDSITFSTSAAGSIVDATNAANVSGTKFTAPASGSGTDTLELQIGGNTVMTFQVSY